VSERRFSVGDDVLASRDESGENYERGNDKEEAAQEGREDEPGLEVEPA
jgi:hypothetical protein